MAAEPGLLDAPFSAVSGFAPATLVAGRFRIVSILGEGGMGKVYEADDVHLGERVALKTIRPEFASDPAFVARFKQEIQAAKRVTHRNVCRIHDIGFHPSSESPNPQMFLTMELLTGETLSHRLAARPLTASEALPLIEQMAKGLEAAHQSGVIHRDLKSANVMLMPDTGSTRTVITDFGLARVLNSSPTSPDDSITRPGEIAGTPAYMAPEQFTGRDVTPATDIYALGVVVYEMLTGERPFRGELPLNGRLPAKPNRPRQLAPAIDPHWEAAILRCLQPKPEDRFQTASDLLRALVENGPVQQKHRLGFVLAALCVLITIAAAAFWILRSPSRQHPTERLEWQQVTNFGDAATDPAFSPDGRLLAFKRGGNWFMNPGQIYLKVLPDGPPVQLTSDALPKMAPAFSPDGSRVAYSITSGSSDNWQIAETSVPLGASAPRVMLTNGEGLTWIDKDHILFSETRQPPPLMAVVTSTESRTSAHDVYVPSNVNWMAHFSALSPDRKSVLLVEMQPGPGINASEFFPCRLVPFDGTSKGKQVGPVPGHCIAAAWSPDGKWMYFSARVNSSFHLWRQSSAGGQPEQITSGPTQEKGFAVAPDGRSVISSVGVDQTTVWTHDASGERQISGEGNARSPRFSPDGKKVYYMWPPDLWAVDLANGHSERVFPGISVSSFAIAPDGLAIVYSASDGSLWYAAIDHRTPPRKLAPQGITPEFVASGDIIFRISPNSSLSLIHPDGTGTRSLDGSYGNLPAPISSISPHQDWALRSMDYRHVKACSRDGKRSVYLCDRCIAGWSPDSKFFWVTFTPYTGQSGMTGLIPLKYGQPLPPLPHEGLRSQADLAHVPGVRIISYQAHFQGISPSPDGASFAFVKQESRWNLYRIPLP